MAPSFSVHYVHKHISLHKLPANLLELSELSVLLAGTFASEIRGVINLVSDIINLETEDSSANANQCLWASRRWGWDRGGRGRREGGIHVHRTAPVSLAKLRCACERLIELNGYDYVSECCGLLGFFPFSVHTYRQCLLLPSVCGEG